MNKRGGALCRATQCLVRNSLSSQEPRVQGTAREQHLVQRRLGGRLGHIPLAVRVEVMLCDSTKKLFDEGGTRAVCTTSQIVHQLRRQLQTSGIERHQSPSQAL